MTPRSRSLAALAAPLLAAGLALSACSGGGGQSGPHVALRSLADHAANFPIAAGDIHGPAGGTTWPDCFACHADMSSGARQLPSSLKVFTCTGCHVTTMGGFDHADPAAIAAAHAGVADYAAKVASPGNLDAACYGCHKSGQGGAPADHQKRFPLPHPGASGDPSQAACSDCHTDRTHPQDVTTLGCATCHDKRPTFAVAHRGVASFTDAAAACVRCHPAGEHLTVSGHTPFLLAPTADVTAVKHLASALAGGDCFGCHATQGTAASDTAVAKPYAQDFAAFSCGGCHVPVGPSGGTALHDTQAALGAMHVATIHFASTADFDAQVAAKGGWPNACFACHGDGTSVSLPPNHKAQLFPLPHPGSTGTPSVASCADCHLDPLHRDDVTKLGCASCHDARPGFSAAHSGVASFSDTPAACVRCHPMGEHLEVKTHTPFLLAPTAAVTTVRHLASALAGGDCFQCHPTLGRPATTSPAMPAKAYAQLFTTTSCVACHATVGRATSTTADHGVQGQLATLHVANGGVATTAAFDAAVTTAGSLSAACLQCHGGGTGDAAPADHAKWFPIGAGTRHAGIGCNQCHTNPANRLDLTAFACASCHALDTSPTLTAGHTVSGYSITSYQTSTTAGGTLTTRAVDMTSSASCMKCHGDGQVDKVASHNQSNQGFGTGRHKTGGCFTCHFTLRTDKTYALAFTTPPQNVDSAGPPPVGCYVCHASGTGN